MSICERDSSIGTYTDTQVKDKHLRDQVRSRTLKLDVRVYSFDAGAGLADRRKKQISTTSDRLELLDRSDPNDFTTAIEGFTIGLGQGDTDAASGIMPVTAFNNVLEPLEETMMILPFTFLLTIIDFIDIKNKMRHFIQNYQQTVVIHDGLCLQEIID
ncbi:unnamed protein product [Rotaria sp. Silwood1]|nr:unnamed protein product [Rotaria sp. Silwood1]